MFKSLSNVVCFEHVKYAYLISAHPSYTKEVMHNTFCRILWL